MSQKKGPSKKPKKNSSGTQRICTTDTHGLNAEEAYNHVNNFITSAILGGIKEIKIIHGIGDGIHRKMTRKAIGRYQEVQEYRYEGEGTQTVNYGATVVWLKFP